MKVRVLAFALASAFLVSTAAPVRAAAGSNASCDAAVQASGRVVALAVPSNYEVLDVNDRGDLAGRYSDPAANVYRGFLQHRGRRETFAAPGARFTSATAVTSSGLVGGSAVLAGAERWIGFLYSRGAFTMIEVPGASATFVADVNDAGTVAGNYMDLDSVNHPFLFREGEFTYVDSPVAGFEAWAIGLNNRGELLVASVNTVGAYDYYVVRNGAARLAPKGCAYDWGYYQLAGITDQGRVFGWALGIEDPETADEAQFPPFSFSASPSRVVKFPSAHVLNITTNGNVLFRRNLLFVPDQPPATGTASSTRSAAAR